MYGTRFASTWLRIAANSCCAAWLVVFAAGCGGASSAPPPPPPPPPVAATPAFWPVPGSYSQTQAGQSVTLADSSSGAKIYYTTDGTTPTTSSAQFSSPLKITSTATIKAIAGGASYSASAVATGTYT